MEIRQLAKEVVTISQDASFREAVTSMMKNDTNSLFVVNDDNELVGEVNVSDLLDAVVPFDADGDVVESKLSTEEGFKDVVLAASDVTVSDFMNTDINPVCTDDTLMTIVSIAIAHQTAHLPIVDHDNRPIGVISRRALKHILAKYLEG